MHPIAIFVLSPSYSHLCPLPILFPPLPPIVMEPIPVDCGLWIVMEPIPEPIVMDPIPPSAANCDGAKKRGGPTHSPRPLPHAITSLPCPAGSQISGRHAIGLLPGDGRRLWLSFWAFAHEELQNCELGCSKGRVWGSGLGAGLPQGAHITMLSKKGHLCVCSTGHNA